MFQYCISLSGKSMWISWISSYLKVNLEFICAEVFSVYQMSVHDLFYSKNRDLSKSDHVCGSESCHWRSLRSSEKELMLLIRLEKVTKPSLKSLDSTNPQSDRLCTNGGNSRPLLPFQEAVAAAGLSKRGSSFSANIIKMFHLFIRKFCLTFLFKKMF